MKIAVIGIGGTGSAACRHLAKAGHTVVGFEQFEIGHTWGSSHGESRIIRYTYPDLLYTQMMAHSYRLWAELEEEAGEDLFQRCGGLYMGPENDPDVNATEQVLQDAGLPYDKLTPDAVRERFPAFRLQAGETALYQQSSGFLRSTRAVLANASLARQWGATLHESMPVSDIVSQGNQVIVRTVSGAEEVFDRAIVTAGAWMGQLFARLNLPLVVSRQQVVYLAIAENPAHFAPDVMPVWIDTVTNYYGFPSDGVLPGVKLASHTHGATVSPDAVERDIDADYTAQTQAVAAHRLPDLSGQVTHAITCLYTNTPDEHFIIDTVPDAPNILLVSGCSGHGFKFTVLLGQIAARLAAEGSYAGDLSRFALERFRV